MSRVLPGARRLGLLFVAALLAASAARAQFTIPPRGTAATLDVASWNVQFYGEPSQGPNDAVQAERVQAVLEQAQIDVWALQEVVSTAGFNSLLTGIADDGYAGVLGPNVSTPNSTFDQKLAFVYNRSVVQVVSTQTILASQSFNFAGRLPLEMVANVTVGGVARQIRFIAIHAKATGDGPSYDRRAAASVALKTYVDDQIAQGRSVVVLGDFNDELSGSISGGGRASPYANFVADTPDYVFATQRLNDQNIGTFCGSNSTCNTGSTIDHILLGGPVVGDLDPGSGDRYGELLTAITQYTVTTSDHLPVLARIRLRAVADEGGPEAGPVALLPASPSPFRNATTLRFRLDAASDVRLDVLDVLGRSVASLGGAYGPGEHRLSLDGTPLAPGLYRVRLQAAGTVRTQTVIRAR